MKSLLTVINALFSGFNRFEDQESLEKVFETVLLLEEHLPSCIPRCFEGCHSARKAAINASNELSSKLMTLLSHQEDNYGATVKALLCILPHRTKFDSDSRVIMEKLKDAKMSLDDKFSLILCAIHILAGENDWNLVEKVLTGCEDCCPMNEWSLKNLQNRILTTRAILTLMPDGILHKKVQGTNPLHFAIKEIIHQHER